VRSSGGQFVPTARRRKSSAKRRKVARRNPALLVTLGAVNPNKGTKTVARRKRTRKVANFRRRRRTTTATRRRRRNTATKIVVMAPRRANPRRRTRAKRRNPSVGIRRRRRSFTRRRSNPSLLGMSVTSSQALKMIAGGLIGVTAAKTLTAMLPAMFLSSPILRIIASGAVAFASGMLVGRLDPTLGGAVAFGGYMQTGSMALNTFIPTLGSRLSLGELMPGQFPIPQNPISGGQFSGPAPRVTTSGINRAFSPAF